MLFDDREVTSIPGLLDALRDITTPERVLWYRGHGKATWKLQPSIARSPVRTDSEMALITRFKQNALSFLVRPPSNEWEWLLLMQHHSLPTRLLDWTENPLVALYFVVKESPKAKGCLWCLVPIALNGARYKTPVPSSDIPCLGVDEELDSYLPKSVLTLPAKLPPAAALAMRSFPRLAAQAGVFTITHKEQTSLEKVEKGKHVGRLLVPAAAKAGLAQEIAMLGITRLSLFPELESVARHAKEVVR